MKRLIIFNTLTRKKEEFIPLMEEGKKDFVGVYTCGPTVYAEPHLGNLRATFTADLLRNILRNIMGYPLKYVMNITDVGHLVGDGDIGEDKMQKGARLDNITAWDVAKKYEDLFLDYMKRLNIGKFDFMPRATDHIQEQIEMVKKLEEKGYTYKIEGDGIYMDTNNVENYGEIIGENYEKHIEGLQAGARVDMGGKKNITDFALWKFSSKDEQRDMEWDSPWGKGFPGWHIECSAMSIKYLGEKFDIHTGGYDLITTHHPNEIAQTECAYDNKPWVKYWMHNQFVLLEGEKQSKSKKHYVSFQDILDRGYIPIDYRYFMLQTIYRKFFDFTWDGLESAKNARNNLLKKLTEILQEKEAEVGDLDFTNIRNYEDFNNKFLRTESGEQFLDEVVDALMDDMNTPAVLASINKAIGVVDKSDFIKVVLYLDEKFLKLDLYKDVIFLMNKLDLDIPAEIQDLAEKRWQAKEDKNFESADKFRTEIENQGYIVKDGKEGYDVFVK